MLVCNVYFCCFCVLADCPVRIMLCLKLKASSWERETKSFSRMPLVRLSGAVAVKCYAIFFSSHSDIEQSDVLSPVSLGFPEVATKTRNMDNEVSSFSRGPTMVGLPFGFFLILQPKKLVPSNKDKTCGGEISVSEHGAPCFVGVGRIPQCETITRCFKGSCTKHGSEKQS